MTADEFLDPSIPMDFMLTGLWRPYPRHRHEFIEINLITNGTIIERINGDIYRLRRGNVVLLLPGDVHDTPWAGKATGMLVRYLPHASLTDAEITQRVPGFTELFTHASGKQRPRVLELDEEALYEAEELLMQIGKEFRQKQPGYHIQLQGLLYQYIVVLCRQYTHAAPVASHTFARLLKVIKFIEMNYKDCITIATLAGIAGMTRRTFLRVFHAATGLTPIQYLLHHRVSTAEVYLRTSAHPIESVARAAGFPDCNYFARQFRKILHMSPTEYRRLGFAHCRDRAGTMEEIHFPAPPSPPRLACRPPRPRAHRDQRV